MFRAWMALIIAVALAAPAAALSTYQRTETDSFGNVIGTASWMPASSPPTTQIWTHNCGNVKGSLQNQDSYSQCKLQRCTDSYLSWVLEGADPGEPGAGPCNGGAYDPGSSCCANYAAGLASCLVTYPTSWC